jgi:hypothetical protein
VQHDLIFGLGDIAQEPKDDEDARVHHFRLRKLARRLQIQRRSRQLRGILEEKLLCVFHDDAAVLRKARLVWQLPSGGFDFPETRVERISKHLDDLAPKFRVQDGIRVLGNVLSHLQPDQTTMRVRRNPAVQKRTVGTYDGRGCDDTMCGDTIPATCRPAAVAALDSEA